MSKGADDVAVFLAEFGAGVRRMRMVAGLSLRDLAPVVGVSSSTLSRIERGHRSMTHDFLRVARWARGAPGAREGQR